jgi:hypothetical protein
MEEALGSSNIAMLGSLGEIPNKELWNVEVSLLAAGSYLLLNSLRSKTSCRRKN